MNLSYKRGKGKRSWCWAVLWKGNGYLVREDSEVLSLCDNCLKVFRSKMLAFESWNLRQYNNWSLRLIFCHLFMAFFGQILIFFCVYQFIYLFCLTPFPFLALFISSSLLLRYSLPLLPNCHGSSALEEEVSTGRGPQLTRNTSSKTGKKLLKPIFVIPCKSLKYYVKMNILDFFIWFLQCPGLPLSMIHIIWSKFSFMNNLLTLEFTHKITMLL